MIKEKIEKVVKEIVVETTTICDKCNNEVVIKGMYNAFEFNFEFKSGVAYPEGSYYTRSTIDLCENCANALVEHLKKEGYRFNITKTDG